MPAVINSKYIVRPLQPDRTAAIIDGQGVHTQCYQKSARGNTLPRHMLYPCATDMLVVLTPEDPEGYPVSGEVVVYTVNITNEGSLTLHDVTPDSSQVGLSECHVLSLLDRADALRGRLVSYRHLSFRRNWISLYIRTKTTTEGRGMSIHVL